MDVVPDLSTSRDARSVLRKPATEPLDQTPGEQRVTWNGSVVHRTLIVQRRRDDAATAAPLHRGILIHAEWARISPLVASGERYSAVTRIDDHQNMQRWQPRDIVEPAVAVRRACPGR